MALYADSIIILLSELFTCHTSCSSVHTLGVKLGGVIPHLKDFATIIFHGHIKVHFDHTLSRCVVKHYKLYLYLTMKLVYVC